MDEFRAYIERTRPSEFLSYEGLAARKREEMESLLAHLELDVKGRRALDLGPGHGDSLDVLREHGASRCAFVEQDLLFYTYNRLKGFDGHRFNFHTQVERLRGQSFDFVYVGHSVAYPNFKTRGDKGFASWLNALKDVVSPDGAIVISPWWPPSTAEMTTPDRIDHWFGQTLLRAGYEPLPWIEGHNREVAYPVSFLAESRSASASSWRPLRGRCTGRPGPATRGA